MMRIFKKNQLWESKALPTLPTPDSLMAWIDTQGQYDFALVHADDGVIWGCYTNGKWTWSSGLAPNSPSLNGKVLQQLRLFNETGEVLVWRTDHGFSGRVIRDGIGENIDCLDEEQLLWGQIDGDPKSEFQVMREGSQGLQHAPPASIASTGKITTRNYIAYDTDGCAFVKASRLMTKVK